ncbi:peptide deformylase [Acerihabitans sp. TG2]|uniref:peptide deformylase n=1 Tax=Acerihabitans sp. TG2 TaxID=3096008 RepID=UPI002B23A65F|nr:peptide deformylase [Acerihabitans sp. TG2]MEA9390103.1 peptide deformylase [Acerihabitans sp. TG2]
MTHHALLYVPDPLLQATSLVVDAFDTDLQELVDNMVCVMRQEKGVGLAAPQLGILQRAIVVEVAQAMEREGESIAALPLTTLINPEITPIGHDKTEGWEGCLSIPGYRGYVERWQHIAFTAQDINGRPLRGQATGFHARIIQHEVDHLNGILYTDRTEKIEVFVRAAT